MSLGKKFLSRLHRKIKPRTLSVSLLSLLETYDPVLRTIGVLKPDEVLVAADVKEADKDDVILNIYVKGGKSRTGKD